MAVRSRWKVVTGVAAASLFAACVVTAPGMVAAQSEDGSSGETAPIPVTLDILADLNGGDNSQWAADYPDEYFSYLGGVDEIEPATTSSSLLGNVQSHAALRANMEVYGGANGAVPLAEQFGATCISCKSQAFSDLYDEYGMKAYTDVAYDDVKDEIDFWDCLNCHDGEPGGELGPNLEPSNILMRNFPDTMTTKEAVCGQCHNTLGPYTRGAIMNAAIEDGKTLEDIDPYAYGVDPDAILQAELENGVALNTDEETGIQTLNMQHPDVEIFQGSVHQSMGLACTDCHMPATENDEGEAYTYHNASQGPLENEVALEFCLTCHAGTEGIETTADMKAWVEGLQEGQGVAEQELTDKLAQLSDAIAAGMENGVDEAVLDDARDAYLHAKLYLDYSHGSAEEPGQKIAHNPQAMRDYVAQGCELVDEALEELA